MLLVGGVVPLGLVRAMKVPQGVGRMLPPEERDSTSARKRDCQSPLFR